MKNFRSAQAGRVEKGDILIGLDPCDVGDGIQISLQSPTEAEFGRHIKSTIQEVLGEYGIVDATVNAQDKGAMDFVVRARTETAVKRALEVEK